MLEEPVPCEFCGSAQGAGFFEQMGGIGDDDEMVLAPELCPSLLVETQHHPVVAADDEQRRGSDLGEVGPARSGRLVAE